MPQPATCRPPLSDVLCAVLVTLLLLLAGGRLLLGLPALVAASRQVTAELRWQLPVAAAGVAGPPPRTGAAGMPAMEPAPAGPGTRAEPVPDHPEASPASLPATAQAVARPAAAAPGLYDDNGRIALPAQSLAGPDRRSSAQRMFEQHDEDFLKHPDDGLFGRAETAGTSQTRAQRAVLGRDVQPARARAAPAIAYNPALHERPADLAAADGPQAYLSAPLADAPVPGLDGQASAQLQPEQASRRSRVQACSLPALATAWTALEQHLQRLQQAEQRMGHGSSPEERRHTLTHEIGRQYNLARRALWQVDHLLPECR